MKTSDPPAKDCTLPKGPLSCPSEDSLLSIVLGENTPENEPVRRHLAECVRCKALVADFRLLTERAGERLDPQPEDAATTRRVKAVMAALPKVGSARNTPQSDATGKGSAPPDPGAWMNGLKTIFGSLLHGLRPWGIGAVALLLLIVGLSRWLDRMTPDPKYSGNDMFAFTAGDPAGIQRADSRGEFQPLHENFLQARTRYRLTGGTTVQFTPQSNIQIRLSKEADFLMGPPEWYIMAGKAHLEGNRPHDPFILQTPHATIRVLGTDLEVEVGSTETHVSLREGRIRVETRTETIDLTGRKICRIAVGGKIRMESATTPRRVVPIPPTPPGGSDGNFPRVVTPTGGDTVPGSSSGGVLDR